MNKNKVYRVCFLSCTFVLFDDKSHFLNKAEFLKDKTLPLNLKSTKVCKTNNVKSKYIRLKLKVLFLTFKYKKYISK